MAALRNPFGSGSKIKTVPSEMEEENAKWQGLLLPFISYLFRISEKRPNEAQMQELMRKFRKVANAYGNRPRHRPPHSVRSAPAAGFYSPLPQELCKQRCPNVGELTEEAMVHSETEMRRHAYCSGDLKAQGPRILTRVKNVIYMPGGNANPLELRALPNAAMGVACNSNGYVLKHAVLPRMGNQSRKHYPNNFAEPSAPATISTPCEIVSVRPNFEDTGTPASFAANLIRKIRIRIRF